MKVFVWIMLVIIGGFVLWGLSIALGIASLPFHAASNIVDTEHGIIDKTLNADNAIYNYEWFKERAEKVKAYRVQINLVQKAATDFDTAAGPRDKWDFQDKQESARLHSVEQGLRLQIESLIAEYNAKSKMANRNIFKDGLFPASFEIGSNILGGNN